MHIVEIFKLFQFHNLQRESFVKSCDSKAVQNFLEWFSETSMFHEFTQLRLRNTHQHGMQIICLSFNYYNDFAG